MVAFPRARRDVHLFVRKNTGNIREPGVPGDALIRVCNAALRSAAHSDKGFAVLVIGVWKVGRLCARAGGPWIGNVTLDVDCDEDLSRSGARCVAGSGFQVSAVLAGIGEAVALMME